nr:acetylornithine transaminase [Alteribacter aurantiacus]
METYQRFPVQMVKGKGSYVWDSNNKTYVDFTSGIATCNLGHVPNRVKVAVSAQLETLWHCSNLYHIPVQEELAQRLTEVTFGDRVFFCNSGAEANEGAIKLARKHAKKNNKPEAHEVVTFTQSFHGRTLATLTATGQQHVKSDFDPLPKGFNHLPYNDIDALKGIDKDRTCAVLLELVQGEGGVVPADPTWVQELAHFCNENQILFMIDEVQTGMGRTGKLFAYEHYNIIPDVMTIAKGLGSGFPIGAVIAKEEVAAAFTPGSHGTTFGGNPLASTAGLATLNEITQNGVLDNANKQSTYLFEELKKLQEDYDILKAVRGKGLLIGIEVTCPAKNIVVEALEHGVLLLTAGANVVRLLPPLTLTEEEVDRVLKVLQKVLMHMEEKDGVKQ